MTKQFKKQGGVSSSDPSAMARWSISAMMNFLFSYKRTVTRHAKAESRRKVEGRAHCVEYFHNVEDPYSHLAAQLLAPLLERYDIDLVCHLVGNSKGDNTPEPDLLSDWARKDAYSVAPEYGLDFQFAEGPLSSDLVEKAAEILAFQDSKGFMECVVDIGTALWAGDHQALERLAQHHGSASRPSTTDKIIKGSQRRASLQHYSSAMFYYAGEWYWGIDRLYHLEKRLGLIDGVDLDPAQAPLANRPKIGELQLKDSGQLTLEIFPSLRSPYTAISFDRAVKLARDTGVKLVVRPVLPMVMRGVPATREKGMYIFMDAAREARESGVDYGKFYDPIGEPVRRAYSLYPWAVEQGKGVEFISSFLACAFSKGVNTSRISGLKRVVEGAGLDWRSAKALVGKPGWEQSFEENRLTMYQAGLWGVPSFRLLDQRGKQVFSAWGQDRLWLLHREIQKQLAAN